MLCFPPGLIREVHEQKYIGSFAADTDTMDRTLTVEHVGDGDFLDRDAKELAAFGKKQVLKVRVLAEP